VEKSLAAPKLEISVETSFTIPSFNVAMETMAYLYMITIIKMMIYLSINGDVP